MVLTGPRRWFNRQPVGVRAAIIIGGAGVLAALIALVGALIVKNGERSTVPAIAMDDSTLRRLKDFPGQFEDSLSISGVILAGNDQQYRIEVTTFNPGPQDALTTHIALQFTATAPIACKLSSAPHYVISSDITLTTGTTDDTWITGAVSRPDDPLAGFVYPAKGRLSYGCGYQRFELDFDASSVLPAAAHTSLYIDLPRTFRVLEGVDLLTGEAINTQEVVVDLLGGSFYDTVSLVVSVTVSDQTLTFRRTELPWR